MMNHSSNVRRTSRFFGVAVCLVAFVAVGCGGGGKESKNQVFGKVLMDGKAVNGAIVFLSADNKEFQTPINSADGTFNIADMPNGNMKVFIRSSAAAAGGGKLIEPKTGAGGPEMPKSLGSTGVDAPAKYGAAATSGLTFEVKGGKQDYSPAITP